MPRHVQAGRYYAFDRAQPFQEIGVQISRVQALHRVAGGGDVYTPAQSDAAALAKNIAPGAAQWHGAHQASYFPHFFPAFNNAYGHIFYGQRGHRQGEMQRGPGESRS